MDRIDIVSGALGKGFGTMDGWLHRRVRVSHRRCAFVIPWLHLYDRSATGNHGGCPCSHRISAGQSAGPHAIAAKRTGREVRRREHALPVLPNQSHIVPLMVGDSEKCKTAADILFDEFGIYVQPINSPSVVVGQERLRISPTAAHTQAHQDHLVKALVQIWNRLGLKCIEDWRRGTDGFVNEGWEEQVAARPIWTDSQLGLLTAGSQQQQRMPLSPSLKLPPASEMKNLEDTMLL